MSASASAAPKAQQTMPFRLGATSYVVPGGWADNVELLGGLVSDVEILFFQAEQPSQLPDAAECARLAALRRAHGLTYSLHTPLAASLASADEQRRRCSVRLVQRAIDAARPFAPELFIVHVYLGDREQDPQRPRDIGAWQARARRSLQALLHGGVQREQLCVELIDYDYGLIEPVIAELGLRVALDVGHLERDGLDVLAWLERLLPRTAVLQWHGTDARGRDHRSLCHHHRPRALALLRALLAHDYRGVLTLEVFSADELHESLALVRGWLSEIAGVAAPGVKR